jgi:hypothetical protein
MSYWNYTDRNKTEEQQKLMLKLTEKSVNLINQYNGEVHLITDSLGKEIFKNIKFASINNYLNDVPKEYGDVWCLGKMFALNKIAHKNQPFIHLDYDFLIFKKIPEYILKKDIIVQSLEKKLYRYGYSLDYFKQECPNKYYCENSNNIDYAYNCGIIGGQDYDFFQKYSKASIDMILNIKNKNFFLKSYLEHFKINNKFNHWTTSILAEQYHFSNACSVLNKNVTFFYKELAPLTSAWYKNTYCPDVKEFFLESKCIHLYGEFKYNKRFQEMYLN